MPRHIRSEIKEGNNEILKVGEGTEYVGLSYLVLKKGQSYTSQSGECEIALDIIKGKCDVNIDGVKFERLGGRNDVFSGKSTTVYVPIDSSYTVYNNEIDDLEIAICKVRAEKKFQPFVITPDMVNRKVTGKDTWERNVDDIIVVNCEGRVDRIILGETFNKPGKWSSFPPHKHDMNNLPYEVKMEEVYHFLLKPGNGFGLQLVYDSENEMPYKIINHDTVTIDRGYHPVVAAPGYQLCYIWIMAGKDSRRMQPNDDPEHSWLKNVEAMI